MKKTCLLLPAFLLFGAGCDNNEVVCPADSDKKVSHEQLVTEANEYCRMNDLDQSKNIVNLIIQSQSDYERYVECQSTLPSINFAKKTLLAGRLKAPHGDKVVNQRVYLDCDQKYVYSIEIEQGVTTAPSDLYYFAIIPKLDSSAQIIFDVKYSN